MESIFCAGVLWVLKEFAEPEVLAAFDEAPHDESRTAAATKPATAPK
jgi:hypothetical protein